MPQTLLLTGASSGIGRACARLFQSRGWNVIATMRSPQNETELTRLPNVLVARADVTDEAGITDALREGIAKFGQVDVLLNNAGYGAYGPIEATPIDRIRHQFETNVIGVLAAIKAMGPHFRKRRAGTIINISSVGGRVAMPLGALYHGSKFAIEGLTEALQFEMAEIGVRVKLVEPGMTRTDFGGRSFQFNDDPNLEEYRNIVARNSAAFAALGQGAADPESVAETVYLAATDGSDRLRYLSGKDAEALIALRERESEADFRRHMRGTFGLSEPLGGG